MIPKRWRGVGRRRPLVLGVLALLLVPAGIASAAPTAGGAVTKAAAPGGTVTNFTDPGISGPLGIAAGSDGAPGSPSFPQLDRAVPRPGRDLMLHRHRHQPAVGDRGPGRRPLVLGSAFIGSPPRGAVTNSGHRRPPARDRPAGQGGAFWFVNSNNNAVGGSATTGTITPYMQRELWPIHQTTRARSCGDGRRPLVRNYGTNNFAKIRRIHRRRRISFLTGTGISGPLGIAAGPDSALWFCFSGLNSIGRITTTGTVTNYTGPGISNRGGSRPGPTGPSGSPTRATTRSGGSPATVPSCTGTGISSPGRDRGRAGLAALWFTNNSHSSIGPDQAFCTTSSGGSGHHPTKPAHA